MISRHSNEEIRRQLGGMPTGPNDLAEYEFQIRHKEPAETQPNESDYDPDAWVALDEVVTGWIRSKQD